MSITFGKRLSVTRRFSSTMYEVWHPSVSAQVFFSMIRYLLLWDLSSACKIVHHIVWYFVVVQTLLHPLRSTKSQIFWASGSHPSFVSTGSLCVPYCNPSSVNWKYSILTSTTECVMLSTWSHHHWILSMNALMDDGMTSSNLSVTTFLSVFGAVTICIIDYTVYCSAMQYCNQMCTI